MVNANNLSIGELEKTLFERMCMTQRLKGLVSSCEVYGHRLKPFMDRLEDFLSPTIKGTVLENLTSVNIQQNISQGEECWLGKDVLEHLAVLLVRVGKRQGMNVMNPTKYHGDTCDHVQDTAIHPRARSYNKFCYRGATFSPSSFSMWDSHVVIRPVIGKGISNDWYAGKIKQIFTYPLGPSSKGYFVIQKFRELSDQEAMRDPYRLYPLVGGRLYHPELEDKIEVVGLEEIIAHFAHTPHDEQEFGFSCFHALPLDKVALLTVLHEATLTCFRIERKIEQDDCLIPGSYIYYS